MSEDIQKAELRAAELNARVVPKLESLAEKEASKELHPLLAETEARIIEGVKGFTRQS